MGTTDHGCVCPLRDQGRVSDRIIRSSATIPRSYSNALAARHRPLSCSAPRGDGTALQRGDRGVTPSISDSGLLQSNILGSQEGRRFPSGVRLKSPECLCGEGEVQDDHASSSDKRIARRGLGSEHRFKRCLLPRPHSRQITSIAKIRSRHRQRASNIPIQSSPVRTDVGPKGVYESNPTRGSECTHASCLSSSVPRRLVTEKSRQATTGPPDKLVARCHPPTGVHTQCTEIPVDTHSAVDTHRCGISPRRRVDVSSDGTSSQVRRQNTCPSCCPSNDSLFLAVSSRGPELSNRCNPTRSIASQTSAAIFAGTLGSCDKESTGANPSEARSVGPPPPLVVGQKVYEGRNTTRRSRGSDPTVHRCVRVGLGSPSRHSPSERSLVRGRNQSPHQSLGAVSGIQCLDSLQKPPEWYDNTTDVRQFDSGILSSETRRDGFCAPVPPDTEDPASSSGRTYNHPGQTHSGGEKCISGPPFPEEQSSSHGMDFVTDRSGLFVHHVGHAERRSVCHTAKQSTSGIRVPHGRSTGSGHRRTVDSMERDVCIRISPFRDAGTSNREDTPGSSLRDDPRSSQMAQSVLVRQVDGVAGRLSFGTAIQERLVDPAPQPPETPVPSGGGSSRLEAVQRSLQTRGFSQEAAAQISRGRRQSSRAVYDSKWRIFAGWCAERTVDPFQVTIPQLADFFMFLFNVKQLNPRTIKGYRSAISSTISSCGSRTEFAHSAELASLIRSFQLERPPRRKVAPQWNLSLVLQALLKPPFEPIARCDLKSLTLKTIFLVALASGRRRSELHALCFDSHHFRQNQDQSMITLYPALDFIAKSQALDAVADPIKLKAFTSVGSADTDRRLCPVRALLQYRKTTATPECRKGRSKLFISYKPSMATEIKKATISSWIVKLIRLAYSTEGEDPRALELHKISAHEVRALSASCSVFRGMSVDTVLQSCTWKSRNTFSDFYLRDMCTFVDDVYVMSSSVAGV